MFIDKKPDFSDSAHAHGMHSSKKCNISATKVDPRSKFGKNILLTMRNHISFKEDATIDILSAIVIFVDFRVISLYKIG